MPFLYGLNRQPINAPREWEHELQQHDRNYNPSAVHDIQNATETTKRRAAFVVNWIAHNPRKTGNDTVNMRLLLADFDCLARRGFTDFMGETPIYTSFLQNLRRERDRNRQKLNTFIYLAIVANRQPNSFVISHLRRKIDEVGKTYAHVRNILKKGGFSFSEDSLNYELQIIQN